MLNVGELFHHEFDVILFFQRPPGGATHVVHHTSTTNKQLEGVRISDGTTWMLKVVPRLLEQVKLERVPAAATMSSDWFQRKLSAPTSATWFELLNIVALCNIFLIRL